MVMWGHEKIGINLNNNVQNNDSRVCTYVLDK